MNKVILMGRLTKDVEARGEDDKKVARYSLAVDRKYSKGEEKQADFINIVVFGKGAEFAEKYLKKGTKVVVTGRIQTGSYEKDGKKVYTTDVIAEEQEFAESKSSSENNTAPATSNDDFMEIPPNALNDMPF